eukprot:TRINITY_DN83496_c0_g1_i1.p1 TRINITY_DN83496_c0_g1~~TRINITY_DN83496_c0_g1_i1.p1  ORF type:complete len:513 (-),score=49.40 TRINITY_DN83496_c0_g1_i1:105-1481(-)
MTSALPSDERQVSFQTLVDRWHSLTGYAIPTEANTLTTLAGDNATKQKRVETFAATTRPFLLNRTWQLASAFLDVKRQHGSAIERKFYSVMSTAAFVSKLTTHRPVAFLNPSDDYLLQDGTRGKGAEQFPQIGTMDEAEPFVLSRYNSYDEMQVAALLGISVPSYFINDGNRQNKAVPGEPGTFETQGVIVDQVGCRFEREGLMEWKHMLVTQAQNTEANGYGANGANGTQRSMLQMFAHFYGVDHFPTFAEAKGMISSGAFVENERGLVNVDVFRRRYNAQAEAFLAECSSRGQESGFSGAYCHVAESIETEPWWTIDNRQAIWVLEGFKQVLTSAAGRYAGARIVDFPQFKHFEEVFGSGTVHIGDISVRNSNRQPGAKLTGTDAGLRVVYQFAGDSNAYPGNEYWLGHLNGSGDPAAASFSLIPFLQNPQIHPEGLDSARALVIPGLHDSPLAYV